MQTTTEQASKYATEIRRAYGTYTHQHGQQRSWASIARLAHLFDLAPHQVQAAITHLVRTDQHFVVAPESNQRALTQDDRDAAVWIGGQWCHLVQWDR